MKNPINLILLIVIIILTQEGCNATKKVCDAYHTGNPHQIKKRK